MNYCLNCRICNSELLHDVIYLGQQYITSRFPKYGDFSTPKTNITLCICKDCGLVQLRQTTNSNELYEHEYGYRSGISNTMKNHLKMYHYEILEKVHNLQEGDVIVDIGSNDSTMLQYYSNKYRRIGVDPTGSQFSQYYGDVELLPTYFTYENFTSKYSDVKCKIVTSISVFYDLHNPVQFAKDIYNILEDDGIWTCEQSYLLTMLKINSIDTICHEHLEYYSLTQIKKISDMVGFKIIDVQFNECNGGSFRIYFAKKHCSLYNEQTELIAQILNEEIEFDIINPNTYTKFIDNCNAEIRYLTNFIKNVNKNGKSVYIYGASTKGNCLLQYANIGEKLCKYAVERNHDKVGKMTSTGIEIISEETMRLNPPDYLLCLPYHFKEEILKREMDFLNGGGQFIFPFPRFEIVGSKPKLLITGCDGMIAHYVKSNTSFIQDYNFYGIGRIGTYEKNMMKFYFDMNDTNYLEFIIKTINPDAIIHLASISSSIEAFNNPIEALKSNGMITANLCDIIHRNKLRTKLFNSSSSEMYKGHIDYEVKENDHNMFHLHPYSIAKIMGHSMVEFYRNTYNLPFSNGIFFTIESPIKKQAFLFSKVANHIKDWLSATVLKTPLIVGNLDSYRNIMQAEKAVEMIYKIISKNEGNNYLICDYKSRKIVDLVIELYEKSGIILVQKENILYENNTNLPVVIIDNEINKTGIDTTPTNIRGFPSIFL